MRCYFLQLRTESEYAAIQLRKLLPFRQKNKHIRLTHPETGLTRSARVPHQSTRISRSRFVFTRDFLTERNTRGYSRRCTWKYKCRGRQDAASDRCTWKYKCRGRQEKVRPGTGREAGLGHAASDGKKILCGNKDQARPCRCGEKSGLIFFATISPGTGCDAVRL